MLPTPVPRAVGVATPYAPWAASSSGTVPFQDTCAPDEARSALRASRTPTAQSGKCAVACCLPWGALFRTRATSSGEATGAPRCEVRSLAGVTHVPRDRWLVASTGVEPATYGLSDRCSTTELPCRWLRPRPRAVHASAIHSASAPGGTREPAPLTRFPSRPLYDIAPSRNVESLRAPSRNLEFARHRATSNNTGPRKRRGPGGQCRPGPRERFRRAARISPPYQKGRLIR